MELRLDVLLADLRAREADILATIDADPLLVKRESGGLVLANASPALFTPQEQHQLYAKGIVYRRAPYRLVSLPLVKIYNAGERNVTVADLSDLASAGDTRLRFLRKFDGSLLQVFRADGRVWFTTRGMIEGATWRRTGEEDEETRGHVTFDFLAEARKLAAERYPSLLHDAALLDGRTLLFEFIHPGAPKITSYGGRADLVLLAAFDQREFGYHDHPYLVELAGTAGLTIADAFAPAGTTLAEQVDDLLASLAGTDQEGSVLCFERGGRVVYRVKIKTPDYLQLLRLMTSCTYDATVQVLDANPQVREWDDLRMLLQAQGREKVPEEVLAFYRQHFDRFQAYLADLDELRAWAERTAAGIEAQLGGRAGQEVGPFRKAFAARATQLPNAGLLFAALDGRLDRERLRKMVRTPKEASEALAAVREAPG